MSDNSSPAALGRIGRRGFLRLSGAGVLGTLASDVMVSTAGVAPAFAQDASGPTVTSDGAVDVGAGDLGVFNFAFAQEQVEVAFYTQVLQTPYAGMTQAEGQLIADIRDNELAHREFFRTLLGDNGIPDLPIDLSSVNFRSRESVLSTGHTFEDLGTGVQNSEGPLIQNPEFLALASKLVSVEARHASASRELLRPGSTYFAGEDVVDPQGPDLAFAPSQVLPVI